MPALEPSLDSVSVSVSSAPIHKTLAFVHKQDNICCYNVGQLQATINNLIYVFVCQSDVILFSLTDFLYAACGNDGRLKCRG